MSNFPRIRELGLRVTTIQTCFDVVLATELEALLERAPVEHLMQTPLGWSTVMHGDRVCTHTARLIGVKPIVKDTHESLLREFVEHWKEEWVGKAPRDVFERARKLLDMK